MSYNAVKLYLNSIITTIKNIYSEKCRQNICADIFVAYTSCYETIFPER